MRPVLAVKGFSGVRGTEIEIWQASGSVAWREA
jgi:hypothetical protein